MTLDPTDPIALTQALIRCRSVTPADDGALGVVQTACEALGFSGHRLPFAEPGTADVDNLYTRWGGNERVLAFAGHTDVVPPGPEDAWSHPPFAAEIIDGTLYGRGAVDMKGAIGCFIAAAARAKAAGGLPDGLGLAMIITGDEEAVSINGTVKMMPALAEMGEHHHACIVGEPTCPQTVGDMVKIGRRGSMTALLTVAGRQGHVAYPDDADNAAEKMTTLLSALKARAIDFGTEHFPPTTLAVSTIDVGNPAVNVIPGAASASFNIRFNDQHGSDDIKNWVSERLTETGLTGWDIRWKVSGESFLTPPGPLSALLVETIRGETGITPSLSTTGGTSDARFIKDYCPVAEFGLVNQTIHQVDERVAVADLERLTKIYQAVIQRFGHGR